MANEIRAIFVDLTEPSDRLEVNYNPDQILDSRRPRVESTDVPGSGIPKVTVGSGGERAIQFTMRLAARDENDPLDIVLKHANWLQSLTFPYIEESFVNQFWTAVQFKWGDLYDLPVIIRAADVTYLQFDTKTALPLWADARMTLQPIADVNISVSEVRYERAGQVRYI